MDQAKAGKIRVFVVDDHAIVRDGIQSLLATEPDIECVGEAANGTDAVSKVRNLRPDVILMDLVMPELDGIHLQERLTHQGIVGRVPNCTHIARIILLNQMKESHRVDGHRATIMMLRFAGS